MTRSRIRAAVGTRRSRKREIYNTPKDPNFYFGGIDLVDLETDTPAWQIPVTLWTESGLVMTHNPFFVEKRSGALRFYFMPEDDNSRLFVYDAVV